MYDPISAISARVAPFSDQEKYYREHVAPENSVVYTTDRLSRCIEVQTGERFVVVVTLPANYDFKESPNLRIKVSIDGAMLEATEYASQAEDTEPGQPTELLIEATECIVDDRLMNVGFSFAECEIDDDLILVGDAEADEIAHRGKILVTITRGQLFEDRSVRRSFFQEPDLACYSKEATRNVAVDRGRSHYLQPIVIDEVVEPYWYEKFVPAKGEAGKPTTFTFHACSAEALNRSANRPRKPSAAPIDRSPAKKRSSEIDDDSDYDSPLPKRKRKRTKAKSRKNGSLCADSDSNDLSILRKRAAEKQRILDDDRDDEEVASPAPVKTEPEEEKSVLASQDAVVQVSRTAKDIRMERIRLEWEEVRLRKELQLEENRQKQRLLRLEEEGVEQRCLFVSSTYAAFE